VTTVRRRIKAEEWRPIPLYPDYEVSSYGQVRSVPRKGATKGKVLALFPNSESDYLYVTISKNTSLIRAQVKFPVHFLVLLTFVGPRLLSEECRHLDGNPKNNRVENLRWGTRSENNLDRVAHGTHPQAARTECPKGHPYDEENTGRDRRNNGVISRRCKTCDRVRKDQQYKLRTSQAQEKRGAKLHGGRVRPGSGSQAAAKGDVRTPRASGATGHTSGRLIEYKRTNGKSIRLTTVVLEKIRAEALLEGRGHLLGFELGGRDYVIVPAEDYIDPEEHQHCGRARE
jgi:hypothetical protein